MPTEDGARPSSNHRSFVRSFADGRPTLGSVPPCARRRWLISRRRRLKRPEEDDDDDGAGSRAAKTREGCEEKEDWTLAR